MIVIENEFLVAYDVDDTLIMYTQDFDRIAFIDPYNKTKVHATPNKKHIELLKKHKAQGLCVMVWSAGGAKWAETVIKTLKLEEYVDLIITKPIKFVDDLQTSEILGSRIYLK